VLHVAHEVMGKLGVVRGTRTLLRLNQKDGFDCPGCAWPDGDRRHLAEFCENGVKAVAEEATTNRVGPEFFAEHTVASLGTKSDYWLGQQGRLTTPMLLDTGDEHYRPISWEAAFDVIASELEAMSTPDEAVFYTSGRTSNEAAFTYQLFARALGTNNLPDCSNMCHESSGVALNETIGIGKGSVLLEDIHRAHLLVIVGQNPGTNHPRMLAALEQAKRNGATIVSVNPLPEAGMIAFRNPQRPSSYLGRGTTLADRFLHIRLGGDQALFQAIGRKLLEAEARSPGTVLDREFIDDRTSGFAEYRDHVMALDADSVLAATGLVQSDIDGLASDFVNSKSTIICWAMGITQHRDAVATIQEFVNVLLLQGNIGRPGAGLCPVRGHSNVQGDRTMGIWEQMPEEWLDRLGTEFGFEPPREHGYDTVGCIQAMRRGAVRVFIGMGGNFVRATPDSDATEAAMRSCALTVQISTKLNRSHTVTGARALILPTLGRTDLDRTGGIDQIVSVEDSMGVVHNSRGRLKPASADLRSEVDIVCAMGERVLGSETVDWPGLASDYSRIRDHISRVVPGHEDYDARVRAKDGFTLPHGPRDSRTFATAEGRAHFTVSDVRMLQIPEGRLMLQTIRSHDQFNTTIYGLDDRYRGIKNGRRVIFVNPDDIRDLGVIDGGLVDIVSEWHDGDRRAEGFRVVSYPTARGCAAAYFPETNVLIPLDSVADRSNTPTSKAVVVRLEAVG
jgi:molybdopterin-dependent oxidoreductase alpha subunit